MCAASVDLVLNRMLFHCNLYNAISFFYDSNNFPEGTTIYKIMALIEKRLPTLAEFPDLTRFFIDQFKKKFREFFEKDKLSSEDIEKVNKYIIIKFSELTIDFPINIEYSFASVPIPDLSFKVFSPTNRIYITLNGKVELFDPKKATKGDEDEKSRDHLKAFVNIKIVRIPKERRETIFRDFCNLDIFSNTGPITYGQIQKVNEFLSALPGVALIENSPPDDTDNLYITSNGDVELHPKTTKGEDTISRKHIKEIVYKKLSFLTSYEKALLILTFEKLDIFSSDHISHSQIERLNEYLEYFVKTLKTQSLLSQKKV